MAQQRQQDTLAGVRSIEAALNRMLLMPEDASAAEEEVLELLERPPVCRALDRRVAEVATACLQEVSETIPAGGATSSTVAVVKCATLVLGSVPRNARPSTMLDAAIGAIQAEHIAGHAIAVFHAMDLIATICADDAAARQHAAAVFPALFGAARSHKKDLTVLFGVAFTVGTLTMADVVNGRRALEAKGLQVLIEIFKAAVRQRSHTDKDLRRDCLRHSREAIMNLTKVPFDIAQASFAEAKWGTFGELLEVDELCMDVEQERQRCLRLLEAFRRSKASDQLQARHDPA